MKAWDTLNNDIVSCERCPRLRQHCEHVAREKKRAYVDWNYWGRPVPNFGDARGRLLMVGLAPGAHGANRTGRMFTGDRSGDWLYRALHRAGYANQSQSTDLNDGLVLSACAITASCHCAPPDNKPTPQEIANCAEWFSALVDMMSPRVFLAFGQIGWRTVVDEARNRGWYSGKLPKFGHGTSVALANDRWLLGSYHPSQQNTFTGRLTESMLDDIFVTARMFLESDSGATSETQIIQE